MYWEEKIDSLKRRFKSSEFRDPFTDWQIILKKVEDHFIIKQNQQYHFTNWSERINKPFTIRTIPRQDLSKEVSKLHIASNYWLIISGKTPTSRNLVYDCKPNSLSALLSMTQDSFYIVEKKYTWFTFFNSEEGQIIIIKSGETKTPFDI